MTAHLIRGNAKQLPLADKSVQMICTSPPYFGLRSYQTNPMIWGGDPECPHALADDPALKPMTGGTGAASGKQTSNKGSQFGNAWAEEAGTIRKDGKRDTTNRSVTEGGWLDTRGNQPAKQPITITRGATCTRCGAWRGELGSEPTPALFVAHLVEVFRECWRVLRDDGVAFVNIGDSMSGGKAGRADMGTVNQSSKFHGTTHVHDGLPPVQRKTPPGTRPKSLLLVPEQLSLALAGFSTVPGAALAQMADELATAREAGDWLMVSAVESQLRVWAAMSAVFDGWIIRSRIAWIKAAPMPESVRDRPTSAWEHIWMLTKQAKYYWDAEAVREESSTPPGVYKPGQKLYSNPVNGPLRNMNGLGATTLGTGNSAGRNLWNYWLLSPDSYSGAHFATYPRELVRRCVAAATSEYGACGKCGAPWRRVVERSNPRLSDEYQNGPNCPKAEIGQGTVYNTGGKRNGLAKPGWQKLPPATSETTGWTPTCKCGPAASVRPCVVADPFAGSFTTPFVAASLGRIGVGVELSPDYIQQARYGRLSQDFLPLAPEVLQAPAAPAPAAQRPVGMFDGLEVEVEP